MSIRLETLVQTCRAFSFSQWEGTTADGKAFYARFRHGWFYCGVGRHLDAAVTPEDYPEEEGSLVVSMDLHDEDPYMTTERMLDLAAPRVVRAWA